MVGKEEGENGEEEKVGCVEAHSTRVSSSSKNLYEVKEKDLQFAYISLSPFQSRTQQS